MERKLSIGLLWNGSSAEDFKSGGCSGNESLEQYSACCFLLGGGTAFPDFYQIQIAFRSESQSEEQAKASVISNRKAFFHSSPCWRKCFPTSTLLRLVIFFRSLALAREP